MMFRAIRPATAVSRVLVVPILCAALSAQNTQNPTFRSRADLVQVDVIAVDKDGNPIRGLTAADFTLRDRGKPQTIATFDEFAHENGVQETPAEIAWKTQPATLKRDVSSNQANDVERRVLIVIDDVHLYKGRTDRAKEIARKTVTDLGPEALMAVLFTSREHSTEITRDRSELLAAIETTRGRRAVPRPVSAFDGDSGLATDTFRGGQDFFDDMQIITTLQDAARMLGGGAARRKAFVLISEWLAIDLTGIYGSMAARPQGVAGAGL
jgi:VWFA-related protein